GGGGAGRGACGSGGCQTASVAAPAPIFNRLRSSPARSTGGAVSVSPDLRDGVRPRDRGAGDSRLQQHADVPGAGAPSHRGRALDRRPPAAEPSPHLPPGSGTVTSHPVQNPERTPPP